MNKKTIFIHIGLEKTGTTSIQNFLFSNASKLQKKSIFYPIELGSNQTSLFIYAGESKYIRSLASENKEIKIKRELPQKIRQIINDFEKSNCQNLVFSNEHLSSRLKNINDIENLNELFKPYDYPIKIILYVRNQIDLLESLYFESIKAGEKNKLSDWANNFTYFELDFVKMLRKFELVFGQDSIIARQFDRKILKNGNAVDDFLDILSVEIDENFIKNNNQNISLGYRSVEFMRMYNLHVNGSKQMIHKLKNLLSDYGNDKQKVSLSYDNRINIFNKYSTSNHEFLKRYLPETSYNDFIKASRKEHEEVFNEDILWDIINHIINKKESIKDFQQLEQKDLQLKEKQDEINILLNDYWYRFGKMSRKRKIGTIIKHISQKAKLNWLLHPIIKLVK